MQQPMTGSTLIHRGHNDSELAGRSRLQSHYVRISRSLPLIRSVLARQCVLVVSLLPPASPRLLNFAYLQVVPVSVHWGASQWRLGACQSLPAEHTWGHVLTQRPSHSSIQMYWHRTFTHAQRRSTLLWREQSGFCAGDHSCATIVNAVCQKCHLPPRDKVLPRAMRNLLGWKVPGARPPSRIRTLAHEHANEARHRRCVR